MSRTTPPPDRSGANPWITTTGEVAHPNAPAGGGGPGSFAGASVLGAGGSRFDLVPHPQSPAGVNRHVTHDERRVLLAQSSKGIAIQAGPATPVKSRGKVFNFHGAGFDNPWKGKPKEEARRIETSTPKNPTWSPASDTFEAVGRGTGSTGVAIKGFRAFLGAIQQQPRRSIERINVFSHGNPGLIAFSGTLEVQAAAPPIAGASGPPADGPVRVMLVASEASGAGGEQGGLDVKLISTVDRVAKGGGRFENTLGLEARLMQDRFTEGAQMWFYLCHSGGDVELLQSIADAFQVEVMGFRGEIWYRPKITAAGATPLIDRSFTSRDQGNTSARGFAHLDVDAMTLRPKAKRFDLREWERAWNE